ncbi:hypothetical protein Emed_002396 [Eimeria media]
MTFLHGAACAVFSFGPPLAIYKGAGLSDQSGTTWLLSLASIFYFLNLFAKAYKSLDRRHTNPQCSRLESLLVASFLPAATCESSVICSLAVDLITAIMEVNTIKYLMSQKTFLSYPAETRLLCVGLGWSLGHIICSNGHLIIRAMASVAFHWIDIFYSVQASLAPILYMSAACLVHMASKRRMTRGSQIGFFVFAGLLVPGTLCQKHMLGLVEPPQRFLSEAVTPLCWAALGLQGALALTAGAACYMAFTTRQQQPHAHKLD